MIVSQSTARAALFRGGAFFMCGDSRCALAPSQANDPKGGDYLRNSAISGPRGRCVPSRFRGKTVLDELFDFGERN